MNNKTITQEPSGFNAIGLSKGARAMEETKSKRGGPRPESGRKQSRIIFAPTHIIMQALRGVAKQSGITVNDVAHQLVERAFTPLRPPENSESGEVCDDGKKRRTKPGDPVVGGTYAHWKILEEDFGSKTKRWKVGCPRCSAESVKTTLQMESASRCVSCFREDIKRGERARFSILTPALGSSAPKSPCERCSMATNCQNVNTGACSHSPTVAAPAVQASPVNSLGVRD